MFFKKAFCITFLITVAFCGAAPSLESKKYVLENLKQLRELVERKKNSNKSQLELNHLFDGYVDDAKRLLENWDKQSKEEASQEEMVKQMAHYMAVLQKLLTILNSSTSEPLETFCISQRNDQLWGSICGDRPTKRIFRMDLLESKDGAVTSQQTDQQSLYFLTKQHKDDSEVQINLGQ